MVKESRLAVRLPMETAKAFDARAERHGRTRSEMLRELVTAFTEGRVKIRVPAERGHDYVIGNED